jgi:hypothetical protein
VKLSDGQAGTLSALLEEGRGLGSHSNVGTLVQWRTASIMYLRGTVPSADHLWHLLGDTDTYDLPYAYQRELAFATHWAPLLGVLQGLLLLHADETGGPRDEAPPAQESNGEEPSADWWPEVLAAIRATGQTGLGTSDAATIAQRSRKTVRTQLQAAVLRGELDFHRRGPKSVYVLIEPA